MPLKGGHFLDEDLSMFDANFFSLPPTEAMSIDPMQRWLLEETYKCLENGQSQHQKLSNPTLMYTD